jgi:hypothetical protein
MKKLYKKISILLISLGSFATNGNAQCTVTITQNPAVLLCGTNPTLTANAPSINQNQPSNTTCMATFSQLDLAQSFTSSIGSICGAGINLTSTGTGTGVVTIQLWTNLPTSGGVMLTTGTVVAAPSTWADVIWPSPISITIGTTYYLVFSGSNTSLCIGGTTADTYPGGNVYANGGFGSFPTYDYTFHTLTCATASYLWSTGSTSAAITPTNSGVYTVTASIGSCTTTAVQSITINAIPTITVNSGAICTGNSFTISPSGASTYTIQGGSAIVSPTTNVTYTVTGTSAAGCVSSTFATSSVTVNAVPTISVSSGTICSGNSFTMIPTGASTYTYSGGSAIVSPTTNTSYSVTGTSSLGCVGSNTAISSVTVNATPAVTSSTSNSLICTGESAVVTASTTATTYTWNTGATTLTTTVSPTLTTTYTVVVTASNGCSNNSNVTINVSPCTGINEASLNEMTVYPNPTSGNFNIELNNGLNKSIQITDVNGKIVLSTSSLEDKININLNHLTNGVYFVKIQCNNSIEIIKVIKQ